MEQGSSAREETPHSGAGAFYFGTPNGKRVAQRTYLSLARKGKPAQEIAKACISKAVHVVFLSS